MRDYDPEREKPIGERVGAGGNYGDELEDGDRPVPADVAEPGDDLALLEDSDDDRAERSDYDDERDERIRVGEHRVHPNQRTRRDCPACGDRADLFFLGHSNTDDGLIHGWVCGVCRATLHELDPRDDSELVEADR